MKRKVQKQIPEKRSHFALLVTLMAVFIAAGIGYFGFMWWNNRNAPAPAIAVTRPHRPIPTRTAPTTTSAPLTSTQATATTATAPVTSQPPVATTTTAPTTTVATTTRAAVVPPKPAPPAPIPVTTKTAPTPTPTPVTATPDRYAAMARDFAASPSGKFTVQFEIVCDPSNITKALREGGSNVWFVPISLKGRSCYRVFWGHYETREAAERAKASIPSSLREAPPAVVSVPQP